MIDVWYVPTFDATAEICAGRFTFEDAESVIEKLERQENVLVAYALNPEVRP